MNIRALEQVGLAPGQWAARCHGFKAISFPLPVAPAAL